MFWWLFFWIVVPPGGVMTALLLSGNKLAMGVASQVLSTPIRLGGFQLSLAWFMSILSLILALVSLSSLRHAEERLRTVEGSTLAAAMVDNRRSSVFHSGRSVALSTLGLVLWTVAGRLKVLRDRQQLVVPQVARTPVSPFKRVLFIVVGILLVMAGDVPLCRLDYNMYLLMNVTPQKLRLQTRVGQCEAVYTQGATGLCSDFCSDVRALSEERLAAIRHARNWHWLGRAAAEIFDEARGVEQGEKRLDELFHKKTCSQVLASVDKSNQLVNAGCIIAVIVSVTGALVAVSHAVEGSKALGNQETKKKD